MSSPRSVVHEHDVFRVVHAGWENPLDASFSRSKADNRWNTSELSALYCCCSEMVARAVVRDRFRLTGVELAELQPEFRPRLVEVGWAGRVVDIASEAGILAAGFPGDYPIGVDKSETQRSATRWHSDNHEGVVCRSASLSRLGFDRWDGDHADWSELAIWPEGGARPQLLGRRDDLAWAF